jgi:hypothetical protein
MNAIAKNSPKIRAFGSLGLLLALLAVPIVSPAAEKGQVYAGLLFSFARTSGSSFDGHSGSEVTGVFAAIPKLDPASGYGLLVGVRGDIFGVELAYTQAPAKGSLFDPTPAVLGSRSASSTMHTVNIDFKFHFWPRQTVGAYAIAGLNIAFLNVKEAFFGQEKTGLKPGSSTEYNYIWKIFGDVGFFGVGLNLGAGLEVALGPRFVLNGGVFFRPTFFSSLDLKPYDASYEVDVSDFTVSGMTGLTLGVTAGLQFYFSGR